MRDLYQFLCMLPIAMARSSSGVVAMLCTSGFVDDIMFFSVMGGVARYGFRYEGPI